MKAFKVEDKAKTEAALLEANGRSVSHTFTRVGELLEICGEAEVQLASFGLTKANRVGVKLYATSGGRVPSAYKYQREVTRVELVRKTSGWFVVECLRAQLYTGQSGGWKVSLTPEQRDIAVSHFTQQFFVQKPTATQE